VLAFRSYSAASSYPLEDLGAGCITSQLPLRAASDQPKLALGGNAALASSVSSSNESGSRTPLKAAPADDFALPTPLAAFVRRRWPKAEAETRRRVEDWPPPAAAGVAPFAPSPSPYADHDARLARFLRRQEASERAAALAPLRAAYESFRALLLAALQSGEIAASARPGVIESDLKALPPVAWTKLQIVDWKGAIARNTKDRRLYYDLHLAEPTPRSTPPKTVQERVQNELLRLVAAGEYEMARGGQIAAVREIVLRLALEPNQEGTVRQIVGPQWKQLRKTGRL
jgi:hypothetical protein